MPLPGRSQKSWVADPKSVAVECAALACCIHTRNKALTGLATVASAGAVWLLKSLKVHAKKTAAEGLEFVA
jgi:hypothetical protein